MILQLVYVKILRKKAMSEPFSLQEISDFSTVDDLYICAMGFEDRSLGSNEKLDEKNYKSKSTVVITYAQYVEDNTKFKQKLEPIWKNFSEKYDYIEYDATKRDQFENDFNSLLNSLNYPIQTITINISAMVTFPFVWLVNFALDHANQIKIIYTEPAGYGNQLESDNSFSTGVKEIFTMKGFSGAALPGYSSLLITFLGYDFVRARGIYDQIQPSKKIGITAEPNTPKLFDLFPQIEGEHRKSYDSIDEIQKYSIFDLEGVISGLTKIRNDNIENNNIIISLNGSKLHHLAALLFAKKYSDIQLILSRPLEYFPKNYSYGVRRTFEVKITKEWLIEFLETHSF